MTCGTCGTCQHRGDPITYQDSYNGPVIVSPYFQCQRFKLDHKPKPGQGAVVQDGSDYVGKMCVEADFGCVKWEERASVEEII